MARSTHYPQNRYMLGQLKAARRAAELTQNRVAALLGVTQAFVSQVERRERRIRLVELSEFAALYEQELDYLLLKPSIAPASPTTVVLLEEAGVVLQQQASERRASEDQVIRHALHTFARRHEEGP